MSSLRKLAKGKPCQARIPHICLFETQTVVLAHYRMPGDGIGIKPDDFTSGAWCCARCHDLLDGRTPSGFTKEQKDVLHLQAIRRTQDDIIRNHPDELIKYLRSKK